MMLRRGLLGLVFTGLFSAPVLASPIIGTFVLSGDFSTTSTATTWSHSSVPDKAVISGATGAYAGLNGTLVTLTPLNSATEPVGGAGFLDTLFLTFDSAPTLAPLDINAVYQGIDSSTDCTLPPADGQTCTPADPASNFLSALNFQNTGNPAALGSTLTWAFGGDSGPDTWQANYTSQFITPYQTTLSSSPISNSYSANFTVTGPTSTPVPEPASLTLMGLGLAGAIARRRLGRQPRS